ncbi:alanine racemase [Streptomyces sp. CC208A]|uniref:alanine racemase n=1 Tax=Streptomyces sp. CC208A TaxID=3044573 RepID=UPI0024A8A223|nr:alanine racemase [Streptomyces sp. CC208A]
MGHETAPLTEHEARLLALRAGRTPVYAYRRQALREAVARIRAASPPGAGLYYSLKANPYTGVVNALAPLVDGFDVCSLTELETALDTGTPPDRVLFTGPAKSRAEAAAALAAGVAATVESPLQARLFAEVAVELGVTGRAVIRLNLPYPGRTRDAEPTPNQFGVAEDDLAEVVDVLRASPLSVTGLQLFWGSQYDDPAIVLDTRKALTERARACAEEFGLALDFVSVGGGIAMPWRDADPPVDWAALESADPQSDVPEEDRLPLVCEYGRSIAGPAGSLLTTVLDVKTVGHRRYVLVDAGMNDLLLASRLLSGGDRGELRVRALGAEDRPTVPHTYVTGPLCSQLDVLAADIELPAVEPGDLLVFPDVGAYGPSFSPGGFLSRDKVREIVF